MTPRSLLAGGLIVFAIVAGISVKAQVRADPVRLKPDTTADTDQALVDKYCVTCHNARTLSGNLSLTGLDVSKPAEHPEVFEKVVRKVRAGLMPPAGMPRPERSTLDGFAASLETRAPFLDHRLVEFAWRLPLDFKVRGGVGKWGMRRLAERYVPRALLDRPKQGFGVPIDSWLRGPLRQWATDMLAPDRLKREGFFSPEPVQRRLREHLAGTRNWQYHLWAVLMFESWLEQARAAAREPAGVAG